MLGMYKKCTMFYRKATDKEEVPTDLEDQLDDSGVNTMIPAMSR